MPVGTLLIGGILLGGVYALIVVFTPKYRKKLLFGKIKRIFKFFTISHAARNAGSRRGI